MPTSTSDVASLATAPQYRSVLFVGALALDELDAALASGADAVCIDLEDAVPPAAKVDARDAVLATLASRAAPAVPIVVRINSLRTLAGIADLKAFVERPLPVRALVLPKVDTGDELALATAVADDAGSALRFACIVETAAGLDACGDLAVGQPRLDALFFGGFDLSTALGAEYGWPSLLYARSRVVHAAARGGVQVLDSPFADLADEAGLRATCADAKALGMTGKVAKRAVQIAAINAAFGATPAEIDAARRVVAAFEADPGKPLIVDGKLIELPTIKRLQRIASRAPRA